MKLEARDSPLAHRRVLLAIGGGARRLSLAEFSFSELQDWGAPGAPPTQFSMGFGPLDLGVPIHAGLRAAGARADAHAATDARLAELARADARARAWEPWPTNLVFPSKIQLFNGCG